MPLLRASAAPSLLSLTLALTATSACSAALSTVDVQSARTAAMVTTALVNDPEIGARPIDVHVANGVARLSGRVRTQAEAARAIELARAVPGVTRVDSTLRIGGDPVPKPDVQEAGAGPAERRRAARDPAAEFAELEPSPGMFAVGAAWGSSYPTDDGLESAWSIGPLVRFGSGTGLGPAVGFDWYGTSLTPPDPSMPASTLRVRPVMAGIAYTRAIGPVSLSPSLVGGYAFNRVLVPSGGSVGRLAVDAGNSFAWRPAVSLWVAVGPRMAAHVSVGHVRTSPRVTFVEDGRIDRRNVSAHATMVSVGAAYTLF